jgi:hypothetical protein
MGALPLLVFLKVARPKFCYLLVHIAHCRCWVFIGCQAKVLQIISAYCALLLYSILDTWSVFSAQMGALPLLAS